MKVKALVDYHDTTIGKIYNTVGTPDWAGYTGESAVWISDDTDDDYILFPDEYEVVDE